MAEDLTTLDPGVDFVKGEVSAAPALSPAPSYEKTDLSLDGRPPTDEELLTLRRVSEKIPWSIYSIAFVEAVERFSYYGTTACFTNFIQHALPIGSTTGADGGGGQAGALGLGQRTATALTTFNSFWQYTMPLFGAYVADNYLGRFKTIAFALAIDLVGHVVLVISAIPPVIKNPNGSMAAFIIGIITMGFGTGGFKPNVNPLIVEQLEMDVMTVKTLKTGERVIVDPAVTASRVYDYFYMFINIGALCGQIGMVYCEHYVGFWLSFLLPTAMLCFCPLVMMYGRKRYKRVEPQGSVLGKAFKLFGIANKGRWSINPVKTYRQLHDGTFWESVKPSKFDAASKPKWMDFNDAWVDEVSRGFSACAVFMWYPLYWLCYNQINNNLISQASTMRLAGVPNDVLTNLNPFSLIILIPVLDTFVYPAIRKLRLNFTPIKRIAAGYFVAAGAMVWAIVIQYYIYKKSDCGSHASDCPNVDLIVWAQTGSYVLIALSEVLASITSLEYAHSKAPANLRSVVQSICLFMNAISSALGFALVPLAEDPYLIWNYGVVAVAATIGGILFYLQFRGLDKEEDRLNLLPKGTFKPNEDQVNNGLEDGGVAPTPVTTGFEKSEMSI
ncbi:POT family-domain-containing protein [Lasiosphaeria miniovina]|uniref:POT family-domain-containing protein n=1 Tax=Lasiosphaeria miniovina TaxID=1954250 RepID=A0AA40E3X4_9PEZI|nr:POT family-domain-containing protein [Lasiosphaeria miniovina]KAK0727129.1 POT family-domain-containing protein [Lasiosphaeria miniovina]